jgi:hypothetical protein
MFLNVDEFEPRGPEIMYVPVYLSTDFLNREICLTDFVVCVLGFQSIIEYKREGISI